MFYSHKADVSFSELIAFPAVEPSTLDAKVGAKAIEVQIKYACHFDARR
jgi:hypothetical protein